MANHHHHHHQSQLQCNPVVLRLVLVLVSVCFVGYLVGPPIYWRLTGKSSSEGQASSSCLPCVCDCSSETFISMPLGMGNDSMADCGKHDPDMSKEMEKSVIELLSEELSLQTNVTHDNLEHAKASILEAKKTSSQYQKEAEKCNTGIETCEEAREKAEAALLAERKVSALWEQRARENGWKDSRRASS